MMMKVFFLCLALVAVADARPGKVMLPLKFKGISPTAVVLPGPQGSAVAPPLFYVSDTKYGVDITVDLQGTGNGETIGMQYECEGLAIITTEWSQATVDVGVSPASVYLYHEIELLAGQVGPATPHCSAFVTINGQRANGGHVNFIWTKPSGPSGTVEA